MSARCPDSQFIKRVYINNVAFRYDGQSKRWDNQSVANIYCVDGERVWGALFAVSESDMAYLDSYKCEGFPKSYGKKVIQVFDDDGNAYDSWVYFRIGNKKGQPSEKYRKTVFEGAEDCNLPKEYILKYL